MIIFGLDGVLADCETNNGEFWPYAQDGQYNSETGNFDARPREYT